MAKIFISHIAEDAELAKATAEFLRSQELEPFLASDPWQLRSGERWFDRISAELEQAQVVIFLLNARSVSRPWINFEAGWAWAQNKVPIPVCFGGLVKGEMPRPYSDIQGLDLRTDYNNLIQDCYSRLVPNRTTPIPLAHSDERVKSLIAALDKAEAL